MLILCRWNRATARQGVADAPSRQSSYNHLKILAIHEVSTPKGNRANYFHRPRRYSDWGTDKIILFEANNVVDRKEKERG